MAKKVLQNVHVGMFVLRNPEVFRNTYETASWYRDVEVQAGEYPVIADVETETGAVIDFPGLQVKLPGKVVGSFFVSSLWGHYGKAKINEDVGKEDAYHWRSYAHSVAHRILEGKEERIILFPHVVAKQVEFQKSDGTTGHTYKLFVDVDSASVLATPE